jgi:hypothetical protein
LCAVPRSGTTPWPRLRERKRLARAQMLQVGA